MISAMPIVENSDIASSGQSSQRMFARKSFSRMPTLKLKRSFTRKLSGGTELKRTLKSSRSIKLASVKGLRSSRQGKNQYKVSLLKSETNYCNDGQNSKRPSENTQRVITRRLSMKPVRILSKMLTFKSRKYSTEIIPQILQPPDSSLHQATCSSTLKDSHFPDQIDIPLEGSGSQGVLSTRKVCPYTYCSLHGGHRDNVPPLKRFVSMRRRQLKTQKSMKMENRPVRRSKNSGNTKKGTQTSRSDHTENSASKKTHSGRSHLRNVKKPARNSPVRTRDTTVSTSSGGGTCGEDEKNKNFRDNAEVLLGETSFPHISFDQYLNDSLAENGYSLSSFLAIKETNMECCCTATDNDKQDSKVMETARNDKQVAAEKKIDESTESVVSDDQPDIINSESMLLQDPGLCGKHSPLTDDDVVAGNEVLGAESSQEKQKGKNSILKLTDPESSAESLNADEFTNASDQSSNKSKGSNQNDVEELTSTTAATCSASEIDTLEEEKTTKAKFVDPDHERGHQPSPEGESERASTTDVSYRMQEGDKKYIKMWRLMYKHAVVSNAGKGENKLPSNGDDKEVQAKDDLSFSGVNSPSCQDTDDENENVVKLVQKAFDEILLPETEDLSSDYHPKSRGMASDEEGDGNTSTSRESPMGETRLRVDNSQSHEEEKTAQRMGNKPKSWSNLKKILLLKRFVKALEKVRSLNLRKPRHLPSDANLEVEKVYLKHMTAEDKKNVEEWMLDYALQKVISKLAPAQKQRVALLVEAFETVLPFQDTENGPPSSAAVEAQANTVQALNDFSDHSRELAGYSAKLLLGKALRSHKSVGDNADDASDKPTPEQKNSSVVEEPRFDYSWTKTVENNPASRAVDKEEINSTVDENVCLAETKDSVSLSFSTPVDIISTSLEEAPTNEIVNEASRDLISDSTTEIPSSKSESHGRNFESKDPISASEESFSKSKSLIQRSFARALGSNVVSSEAPSDPLDVPEADRKEAENIKQLPTPEETEIQQEKQKHTGLWYLVYKHMASGIAANDFKPLVDVDDEKESGYDDVSTNKGTNTSISYESMSVENQDTPLEHNHVADPEAELRQMEAIRIVEDAIDAILPDDQEHSPDDQSVTDGIVSDHSKQSHKTRGVYDEEERVISSQEKDEEPALKEGNKANQLLPRSWSNLRKVIMLRRFIKALEKVKKFNPRGPRYLSVEPDPEAEKVNLRHQDMEERRGSEEWMLDYALRQVVTKLTPARKRKVGLLVEAFETLMPTTKN